VPLRRFTETLVLAVRDYADDFDPRRCTLAEPKALADCALALPEAARKCLVHDRDRRRTGSVVVSEITAGLDWRSHRLEVTGCDFVVVHNRASVIRRGSFTFEIHATVAEISRSQLWMRREARRAHARQCSHVLKQTRLETPSPLLAIACPSDIDGGKQTVLGIETQIDTLRLLERWRGGGR